jgi:DNA invertase Pin-like site-specific DNA recombinase
VDVHKTLRELHAEKKRLDAAIHSLERQVKATADRGPRKRRGRKSMSAEERRRVSERMTRYWEARRAEKRASGSASGSSDGDVSV